MNKSILQLVFAALSCLFGVLLILPSNIWMPSMAQMTILALAVIAFGVLAIFVAHEGDGDEREEVHRALAGRTAFLAGGAILLFAIVVESIAHTLDQWLVLALLGMVIGKEGANFWNDRYR